MKIYLRQQEKLVEEKQYGSGSLTFLYQHPLGRLLLKVAILPVFSRLYGLYNDSRWSKAKIARWIDRYDIDRNLFEEKKYTSFNDFFKRRYKSVPPVSEKSLIAPAEGNLRVYRISDDLKVQIKGSSYTLTELLQDEKNEKYREGYCLVFHLTMESYHRYCHVDDGRVLTTRVIPGKLHTVSSISKDFPIYKENYRSYDVLQGRHLGELIYMEVGAMLAGKICDHGKNSFSKGSEKGYFELGGSTIVLLLQKNKVELDEDIIACSQQGIEVRLSYQEEIGQCLND